METAQCIWECVIEAKHEYGKYGREASEFAERIEALFDRGFAEVRALFRDEEMLDACDEGWGLLEKTFVYDERERVFACYDWEYVPVFLDVCVDGYGCLRKDWKERLTADFSERAKKA